ncbi:unnamed protein product [Nesidiocoris tenuis]|uniref:BHLH domain-containing protein n=1 Tax=Nesidiocoris tenuis TaxID=355587 RepID=A0A6H5H7X9_9HEMI|nr:unnamed protein product [Nesidiocoris tenuis]
MASLSREEKLRLDDLQQGYDEDIGGYCRHLKKVDYYISSRTRSLGGGERADSPPVAGGGVRLQGSASGGTEREKRIRREIANSNERRRMQSINAGFQSLRTLLPHHEGEKLSKVSD